MSDKTRIAAGPVQIVDRPDVGGFEVRHLLSQVEKTSYQFFQHALEDARDQIVAEIVRRWLEAHGAELLASLTVARETELRTAIVDRVLDRLFKGA